MKKLMIVLMLLIGCQQEDPVIDNLSCSCPPSIEEATCKEALEDPFTAAGRLPYKERIDYIALADCYNSTICGFNKISGGISMAAINVAAETNLEYEFDYCGINVCQPLLAACLTP